MGAPPEDLRRRRGRHRRAGGRVRHRDRTQCLRGYAGHDACSEPGSTPLRVLHLSDIHMRPTQRHKQAWLRELSRWEPDLVVNTGDNLSTPDRSRPWCRHSGICCRYRVCSCSAATTISPRAEESRPSTSPTATTGRTAKPLPWQDLRAAFSERGWLDLTHNKRDLEVAGLTVAAAGVDDAHLQRDRYETIAGAPSRGANLSLGVTHAPYTRVLDRFAADGYQLVMAGHTHGGQLCLPFYGALVTNCDLDRSRAREPRCGG